MTSLTARSSQRGLSVVFYSFRLAAAVAPCTFPQLSLQRSHTAGAVIDIDVPSFEPTFSAVSTN
jgi:hypothetical protein